MPSWTSSYELIRLMNAAGSKEPARSIARMGGYVAMLLLAFEAPYVMWLSFFTTALVLFRGPLLTTHDLSPTLPACPPLAKKLATHDLPPACPLAMDLSLTDAMLSSSRPSA